MALSADAELGQRQVTQGRLAKGESGEMRVAVLSVVIHRDMTETLEIQSVGASLVRGCRSERKHCLV